MPNDKGFLDWSGQYLNFGCQKPYLRGLKSPANAGHTKPDVDFIDQVSKAADTTAGHDMVLFQ